MKKSQLLLATSLSLIALMSADPACAQDGTPPAPRTATPNGQGLGEIVVTANKRSEQLQRVPAAISAVTGVEIQKARIEASADLPRISPGVAISQAFGNVQINIRGLGLESTNPANEPSVQTYVDGVYVARPTALGAVFDDLERIEVLRGPQGTLYGRNATGGVVNFITRTPGDKFAANLSTTYGSYNRVKVSGGVDIPITEGTSARFSFLHDSHGGDQINLYTGKHIRDLQANGGRGTLVSHVSDNFKLTLRGDYYKDKVKGISIDLINGTESPGANAFGSTPSDPDGVFDGVDVRTGPTPLLPNDGKHVSFNAPNPYLAHTNWGTSATADWTLNDHISLKSISAYRDSFLHRNDYDDDGSPASIIMENFAKERSHTFTQELNLNGQTDNGANWVIGAYYFHEKLGLDYLYTIPALALLIDHASGLPAGTVPNTYIFQDQAKTRSFSLFAQGSAPITDKLKLTAGLRKNYDRKSQLQYIDIFGGASCGPDGAAAHGKWNDLTWKVGLDYQFSPNHMAYALISKGFKAGGLNISLCDDTFQPENVVNYEIGTKNTFMNGKLLLNMSAFYYDYSDLQVQVYTSTANATENAASARVYGLEWEAKVRPIRNLEIGGNLSYLFAEYRDFMSFNPLEVSAPGATATDLSGYRIPHAPKWLGNLNVDYTIPLDDRDSIDLRYDMHLTSGYFGEVFHNPGTYQGGYAIHNLRGSYRMGNYEIGAFVDNLGDKVYKETAFAFGTSASVFAIYGPRRTWGVFANAKF